MFQRMLVPLDGSRFAEQALPLAMHLARMRHGALVLLQVIHAPVRSGGRLDPPMFVLELADTRRQKALRYLSQLKGAVASPGIDIEIGAIEGPEPETICDAANLYHADSIVLASHGQTGPMRTLFGSVAREVVRRSGQSVLVVHSPQTVAAEAARSQQARIAILLTDVNDVDRVLEPAMALGNVLSARMQFMVLAEPVSRASSEIATKVGARRLALIEQRLDQLGVTPAPDISLLRSVEDFLQATHSSIERIACLVMVSHPHLREAHITASVATSTLFHHPPDAMLFLPAPPTG